MTCDVVYLDEFRARKARAALQARYDELSLPTARERLLLAAALSAPAADEAAAANPPALPRRRWWQR